MKKYKMSFNSEKEQKTINLYMPTNIPENLNLKEKTSVPLINENVLITDSMSNIRENLDNKKNQIFVVLASCPNIKGLYLNHNHISSIYSRLYDTVNKVNILKEYDVSLKAYYSSWHKCYYMGFHFVISKNKYIIIKK